MGALFRPKSAPYTVYIYIHYLIPMLYRGKKKLLALTRGDGSARSNLTFAFQNCRVKFAQHFSRSYALILNSMYFAFVAQISHGLTAL